MGMDVRRLAAVVVVAAVTVLAVQLGGVFGNLVFKVENKFRIGGKERTLSALKAHDDRRRGRILSSVDLPLGGNGQPSETGLYFAKIGLGSPSKDYYVQVDTGSDILWVNCAGCSKCPTKSDLGIELTLFDPAKSETSGEVGCNDDYCISTYDGELPGCKSGIDCQYSVTYGDGSSTSGFFVKDYVQLEQATGNLQTGKLNTSIIFGCGAKQSGDLGSSSEAAVDGILGFGQANSSMLSQLAAAGKVKKEFAHCLDVVKGGGIFAIGDVVSPIVSTTPLVPNMPHYNVNLKAVEVGGDVLQLPTDLFESGGQRGTIIDSGTTLAYLPSDLFEPMMTKILDRQQGLQLHTVEEQFSCFKFSQNIDDGFPPVKFHFENSLTLTVYPHEYLFLIREYTWCFGWQNGGVQSHDGKQTILLGDLVLSSKLVVYDMENQTIGWTEYNYLRKLSFAFLEFRSLSCLLDSDINTSEISFEKGSLPTDKVRQASKSRMKNPEQYIRLVLTIFLWLLV
ncbi:hypothetical protein EZV62_024690 [Acer yangbiense]|uniref:Peptidase A1 domain-containing protein n=1 Tax=Acer yangbiense TaxID=1000413 RepID=A0A5C7GWE7_9ROSI|nr:hypothetical protein EZV62_024690 [Acer yangbiense]